MVTKNKSVGLGDTIEKITEATGIKSIVESLFDDCGCQKRKEWLNKRFPYKNVQCLTEQEYNYLSTFNLATETITHPQQVELLKIYNRIFNKKQQMTTCSSCWREIIHDIKDVFNSYKNN